MEDDLIRSFLDYKKKECGLSPRTLEAYEHDLSQFCACLNGREPTDAQESDIHGYLLHCNARNLNPATINRRIATLREFFKQLQRDRVIAHDPMRRIELLKQWKRVPKAITELEARQLLESFSTPDSAIALRDRAMLELLYASGLRVDELVSAKLADLHPHRRTLTVTGKGSKQREVPFGLLAAGALQSYLAKGRTRFDRKTSEFLFIGQRGEPLTRQRVWQIVKRLGRQFNLPQISPHTFRHSCATHMLDKKADLRTIQTVLGHAEISTTQLYTKVSQERLHDVMKRCHPRENPARQQIRMFEAAPTVSGLAPGGSPSFSHSPLSPLPCVYCATPAMEGKAMCEKHLLRARETSNRLHARRRKSGLCIECKNPAMAGKSQCETHLRMERERYAAKRKSGLCVQCKNPATVGKSLCETHLRMKREYAAKRKKPALGVTSTRKESAYGN